MGVIAPRDAFARGILHAVRALEIDNTRAETRALLAQYTKQLDYDWPEIERELTRARQLSPSSPFVRMMYALGWLIPQGHLREAVTEFEAVLDSAPTSAWASNWLGVALVLARDWDRATRHARAIVVRDPTSFWGHWLLSICWRVKGMPAEAVAAQQRAIELDGESGAMLGWYGLLLGCVGRTSEARAVLARLEAMARTTYVPPTSLAWVYLGLGERDKTFEWLDRAVDERDQFMMPIKSYAFFDPIRPDPRFAALLQKMNLQP